MGLDVGPKSPFLVPPPSFNMYECGLVDARFSLPHHLPCRNLTILDLSEVNFKMCVAACSGVVGEKGGDVLPWTLISTSCWMFHTLYGKRLGSVG